jgi:hypothetical protein
MPAITAEVNIDASTDAVWDVVAAARRLPEFSSTTVEMLDAPERLERKGQTFVQVVKVLGKRWTSKWTVLAIDPGSFLETEGTVARAVTFHLTQRLTSRGSDTSTLSLCIEYTVPGGSLGNLASKAGLVRRARVESSAILDGIKSAAEAGRLSPA